jgi:hypothetical protein
MSTTGPRTRAMVPMRMGAAGAADVPRAAFRSTAGVLTMAVHDASCGCAWSSAKQALATLRSTARPAPPCGIPRGRRRGRCRADVPLFSLEGTAIDVLMQVKRPRVDAPRGPAPLARGARPWR